MTRILVVDNHDSFVYNLVAYLTQLGAETHVIRSDEVEPREAEEYDGVLVSPGPGRPEDAGRSVETALASAETGVPLLGVCLGHQAIAVAFGGEVTRAEELLHGKTSAVHHDHVGVMAGLPSPLTATRYHSLAVAEETLPDELEVTARTESGVVMALRHRTHPVEGVQFHPESILSSNGHRLLANWLRVCGNEEAAGRAVPLSEAHEARRIAASR